MARTLIPAMRRILTDARIAPAKIARVAVAAGPGSFTGLRIGVTAAKTMAYAAGSKLVALNTLDVLAAPVLEAEPGHRVWALLDAQRNELFAACYDPSPERIWGASDATKLLSADDWLAGLRPGDRVVGPVVAKYADRLPAGVLVATEQQCQPSAQVVGRLGAQMLDRGLECDPFQLVPYYHRLSAAEEKVLRG